MRRLWLWFLHFVDMVLPTPDVSDEYEPYTDSNFIFIKPNRTDKEEAIFNSFVGKPQYFRVYTDKEVLRVCDTLQQYHNGTEILDLMKCLDKLNKQ